MKPPLNRRVLCRISRQGLTFVEVLIGVTLMALVLMTASSLLFSLSRFWVSLETDPRFEQHVEGVIGLLQYAFDRSVPTNPAQTSSGLALQTPPGQSVPMLHFRLDEPMPLFVTEDVLPVPVNAYLGFEREQGLYLLWQPESSSGGGRSGGTPSLFRQILSQKVSDVRWGYYDESTEEWTFESMDGENRQLADQLPSLIQITFTQGAQEWIKTLRTAKPLQHALVY
jgi:hypothetical protein